MRLSFERLEARENPSPAGPQVNDPLAPPDPTMQPPTQTTPPPTDPTVPVITPPVVW